MRRKFLISPVILVALLFMLVACGGNANTENNTGNTNPQNNSNGNQTTNENLDNQEVEENSKSVEESTEEVASTPIPISAPIIHETMPNEPQYLNAQNVQDCNTGWKVDEEGNFEIQFGCDRLSINFLERPYSESNEYKPEFDIVSAGLGFDEDWYYFRIGTFLPEDGNTTLNGQYAIELDLDLNTSGDVLILANNPAQNGVEWNVAGLQLWFDQNDDIGGALASIPDEGGSETDGFEMLLFDEGLGDDQDLIWVRISPEEPNIIQFAIKNTFLKDVQTLYATSNSGAGLSSMVAWQSTDLFMWWAWAGENLDPALFDFIDSNPEFSFITLDNSCGWIFGGVARPLNNICPYFIATATPTRIPQNSSPQNTPLPNATPTDSCTEPPGGCYALYGKHWDPDKCECVIIN